MGWVYMIECGATGDRYVGSTKGSFESRICGHKYSFKKGVNMPKLQALYNKYGIKEFNFIPVVEVPNADLAFWEGEGIKRLKPSLNSNTRISTEVKKKAREAGLKLSTVWSRMRRGYTEDDALYAKIGAHYLKNMYDIRGKRLSLAEISRDFGISYCVLERRAAVGDRGECLIRPVAPYTRKT